LDVYLAIPVTPAGSAAQSDSGEINGRATRYRMRQQAVTDAGGQGDNREIQTAAANLKILFGGESLENSTAIKICELGKTSTGGFEIAEGFVAPTLNLRTSPILHGYLRKMLEVLSAKSTEFSKQRRNRGTGLASFSTSEAASFWLLHTVNGFIPRMQYYFQADAVHPLDVYMELAQLCGYMYSFASEGHPKDTPAYNHADLGGTFARIDAKIRELMETIIPTRCNTVTLEQPRPTMFTATIKDDRVLEPECPVYLAISADVPSDKIAAEAPLKFKISSIDKVDQLITAALRGLQIRHLPAPPSEIPVQPGRQYFVLDKSGDHWEAIRETRTISMYLPPEFSGLKIEMMAVMD
ncbi:MAG: type VI secretion system baseplate subunit TssK, partial [Planctomycetes bacterium]|nr:type VI secretion system baseplate subunit TssK [Planctomycetota bacterium]